MLRYINTTVSVTRPPLCHCHLLEFFYQFLIINISVSGFEMCDVPRKSGELTTNWGKMFGFWNTRR
jgi:hypothetical protein